MFGAEIVGILSATYFSSVIGRQRLRLFAHSLMGALFLAIAFLPLIG